MAQRCSRIFSIPQEAALRSAFLLSSCRTSSSPSIEIGFESKLGIMMEGMPSLVPSSTSFFPFQLFYDASLLPISSLISGTSAKSLCLNKNYANVHDVSHTVIPDLNRPPPTSLMRVLSLAIMTKAGVCAPRATSKLMLGNAYWRIR